MGQELIYLILHNKSLLELENRNFQILLALELEIIVCHDAV